MSAFINFSYFGFAGSAWYARKNCWKRCQMRRRNFGLCRLQVLALKRKATSVHSGVWEKLRCGRCQKPRFTLLSNQ